MTELAKHLLGGSQAVREMPNYLIDTFDDIKGKYAIEGVVINTMDDLISYIKDVAIPIIEQMYDEN